MNKSLLQKNQNIINFHSSKLLMVSQMPFLYSPKQCKVAGTISKTMTADHPLMIKEARMFFCKSEERLLFMWLSDIGRTLSCFV